MFFRETLSVYCENVIKHRVVISSFFKIYLEIIKVPESIIEGWHLK